ncbi:MAG: hypothetical protein IJU76_11295 [Desulfovibrionaceae bacterium]|nr:hypothetical protein [Desulfovibrionaceae bacterium]
MIGQLPKSLSSKLEESRAYQALAENLRRELEESQPDEGEVFSILDLLYFALESEEKAFMGDLGLQISNSLLSTLNFIDTSFGKGLFRYVKLIWYAPFFLNRLMRNSAELHKTVQLCSSMVRSIKLSQLVRFVEKSGGTASTPVIKKWLAARSVNISPEDWQKLKTQAPPA